MSSRAVFSFPIALLCVCLPFAHHATAQSSSPSFSSISTTSAAAPAASVALQRLNCQAVEVYDKPDAWASYPIQAIEEIDGAVTNSSKSWNLTTAVAEIEDIYNNERVIERTLFLDTSSTLNGSINDLPFGACSFVLSLPATYNNRFDKGECLSIFDDACVRDLKAVVAQQAMTVANQKGVTAQEACASFTDSLLAAPSSCKKFASKNGDKNALITSVYNSYLNLSQPGNYTNCTEFPSTKPVNFFSQSFEPTLSGENTTISAQAGIISPVLFALFSNATIYSGPAFGDARLICAKPSNTPNGLVPATGGAAETLGGFTGAAVMALLLNAFIFFLL